MILLLFKIGLNSGCQSNEVAGLDEILNSIITQEGCCGHSINRGLKGSGGFELIGEQIVSSLDR